MDSARPLAAQGKDGFLVGDALRLGLGFGQAHPGHFGVGVGDRGNGAGIEGRLVAGDHFRRHLAFVHRLVRQHGLADDVADGEDVRHVGALLLVHRDEALLVDLDAGVLGTDQLAVGATAHRHQHAVEELRCRGIVALSEEWPRNRRPSLLPGAATLVLSRMLRSVFRCACATA